MAASSLRTLAAAVALCAQVHAFLPYQNPPWPANWNMSLSSITMACNSSGWFNTTVGGAFGIASYDVESVVCGKMGREMTPRQRYACSGAKERLASTSTSRHPR